MFLFTFLVNNLKKPEERIFLGADFINETEHKQGYILRAILMQRLALKNLTIEVSKDPCLIHISEDGIEKQFPIVNTPQKNTELKMYLLVNTTVKMDKGKIGAQCGHAASLLTAYMLDYNRNLWDRYIECNYPKVALKASSSELETLYKKYQDRGVVRVVDAGRTQIPAGTFTVLGFLPMTENEVPEEIRSLKLL